VKYIAWDQAKNEQLKEKRGVSFEEVMDAMFGDGLIKTERHPNWKRYPRQYMHTIEIKNYVYLVPFVEDKEKYFFKTIIPSRKATKRYLTPKKGGV
jgi:uncharacterized DUF497 family protein